MVRRIAVVVLFCVIAVPAYADSIAFSSAVFDWTGLNFTLTGTLQVDHIDPASLFASSTTRAEVSLLSTQSSNFLPLATSAQSSSGVSGSTLAMASTNNGLLQLSTATQSLSIPGSSHRGDSSASTSRVFWLYGTGVGSLSLSLPYTLIANCDRTNPGNETATAFSTINLSIGPGAGTSTSDTVSCSGSGNQQKTGFLTLSKQFDNPFFGPLVSIDASGTTQAIATVPESSSAAMLVVGLVFVSTFWFQRKDT